MMNKSLKNYIIALLGPIALLNKKKIEEFTISLVIIAIISIFHLINRNVETIKVIFVGYFLFSISFTYATLAQNNSFMKNLYNGFFGFLVNLLFGFMIYGFLDLMKVFKSLEAGNVFLLISLLTINFFILGFKESSAVRES